MEHKNTDSQVPAKKKKTMRENIGIFRGKDTIEHKWRYGNLTVHGDTAQIWEDTEQGLMNCLVDPETVGEYTGLTDSNGTGIFEGDILRSFAAKRIVISVVKIGAFKPDFFMILHTNMAMICPLKYMAYMHM